MSGGVEESAEALALRGAEAAAHVAALHGAQSPLLSAHHCRVVKCAPGTPLRATDLVRPLLLANAYSAPLPALSAALDDDAAAAGSAPIAAPGAGVQRLPAAHDAACADRDLCLGCGPVWHAVQTIQEAIRPWNGDDLLRFDAAHGGSLVREQALETGAHRAPEVAPLHTELVHTLVGGEHTRGAHKAACVWCFVPPSGRARLQRVGGGDVLLTPELLAKEAIDAVWCVQAVGETVVVPPGWCSYRVYVGSGWHAALEWRILRASALANAARVARVERLSLRNVPPVSLVALAAAAAAEQLDVLERLRGAAAPRDDATRRQSIALLRLVLPLLQAESLEDALQEPIEVSGLSALAYEPALASLDAGVPAMLQTAIKAAGAADKTRRAAPAANSSLDDSGAYCDACGVVLFNSRRSCDQCNELLCSMCYTAFGHKHTMVLQRRIESSALRRLVRAVACAVGVAGSGVEFMRADDESRSMRSSGRIGTGYMMAGKRRRADPAVLGSHMGGPSALGPYGNVTLTATANGYDARTSDEDRAHANGAAAGDDDDDDDRIDCVCGRNDDRGFMLFCERCRVWLHGRCVGVSKKNVPDVFVCSRCVD